MVSFRNSQLQAILTGMVVADALGQGQLPWGLSLTDAAGSRTVPQPVMAVKDDRWCRAIAAQLQVLTADAPPALSPVPLAPATPESNPAQPQTLADLLTHLPSLLKQLDTLRSPPTVTADAPIAALHASLHACLAQDEPALRALQARLADGADRPWANVAQPLNSAIAGVLAAQGDFQLAVGHSRYWSPAIVGLPALTGILSAGWGDLSSVPSRYRHWLSQPDRTLQRWLQQRWQIASGSQLDLWAVSLWHGWLGREPGAQHSPAAAVLPITVGNTDVAL